MKKIMVGMGVVGVLLISLASAGLVDFLSNTVTGSVEVEGPVFYLDKTLTGGHDFSLKLNDDDVLDGVYTLGNTQDLARFTSESLGIDRKFYEHDFEISLVLEAYGYDENKTGVVDISIDVLEEDGTPRGINLCNDKVIGIKEEVSYDILCLGKDRLKEMNPSDRIRLSIEDDSGFAINEKIFISGDSKFQVVAQ